MSTPAPKSSRSTLASNRKARRDYEILDTLEAGISLVGTEVKSIRAGHISLTEGFAHVDQGQVILEGVNILPYDHGNVHNHDPVRPRRLLLHRREINRLIGQTAEKGLTLIPLKAYLKRGRIKIEIGLARGKHHEDKRETLKRKTADREAARAIAEHRKR